MSYTFRPAVRENTPLIIGIAGPTKSGKTYSAHRLAAGLANGGPIVMINAEGPRGHQYAEKFKYLACDMTPPHRYTKYSEVLREAAKLTPAPAVVIIDSASHAHDGPGGYLEWHEEVLDRMAGTDYKKRERSTFAAWVEPRAAENEFIYAMNEVPCSVILCFRAKEKIKIVPGKEPIDLGWQPIAGERVAFETIFTLMLPPHSKGVPDLEISDLREPFDALIPKGKPIDEELGRQLAAWARGAAAKATLAGPLEDVKALLAKHNLNGQSDADKTARGNLLEATFGTRAWSALEKMDPDMLRDGLTRLRQKLEAAS